MPNIKYSYVFDEEIDRIYDCFTEVQINSGIVYQNLISQLHFIKGERFDKENSEFSLIWKNYYNVKLLVQNVQKLNNFKTYANKVTYIDKISLQLSLIFNFYWDTIDQKTLFIIVIEYQDEFFTELIKEDFNQSDFLQICHNVEDYINSIIQGLDINISFLLNAPFEEIWKTISNPEIFFTISGKKLIPIFKDKEVSLDSILEFYDSNDKQQEPTIMTQMIADIVCITTNYIKVSFVSLNKLYLSSHRITFIVKKFDDKKNMFIVIVKLLEPSTHKKYLAVQKFWKKIVLNYYNHFENKNKIINKNKN